MRRIPLQWSGLRIVVLVVTVMVACPPRNTLPAAEQPAGWPASIEVERQPFVAATKRLVDALQYVGEPLSADDRKALEAAYVAESDKDAVDAIQSILDRHCLAAVHINPESRVKVVDGPVEKELVQQGWRSFLVKVHNEAGITPKLVFESENAQPVYQRGRGPRQRPQSEQALVPPGAVGNRWLDAILFDKQPLKPNLSGLAVEYRVLQLFSRDAGPREAELAFNVGQGTQDLGFRNAISVLFHCLPAVEVALGVHDEVGQPTTAAFIFRDDQGRVVPNPARRLAPDFFFHDQIYRADGEIVHLPPGDYRVTVARGPESLPETRSITVPTGVSSHRENFQLKRWVHAAKRGWWSGDHHVHAAGCAHYDSPTEGVTPADMLRHILGEDLNVGCVLSWGPCWYTQKQYFEGRVSDLSRPNYLMRYDVEVSGFPSSHAGHLCLLRLTEDDYPGTDTIEQWPSWTLPVLQWGQKQGGVVGYSHSGWGLALPDYGPNGQRLETIPYPNRNAMPQGTAADKLPDYAMPPFDGIGANEFIMTVTHDACDFISAVDTPSIWELNIWYHTLNCGFRSRISGETDFPCIYGDKVGLGRIYVGLPRDEPVTFDKWIAGVKNGRSYCGDGLSHIFDFRVTDSKTGQTCDLGLPGPGGAVSQLDLKAASQLTARFDVAAFLEPEPTEATEAIRNSRLDHKPYWHLERCRIGESRKVPVELIVNGQSVARQEITADGSTQPVEMNFKLDHSSWVAVRILPSVHTNPIFVQVGDQPIHASQRSARWCREAVDVCWKSKVSRIREEERPAAQAAYDHARETYDRILSQSRVD